MTYLVPLVAVVAATVATMLLMIVLLVKPSLTWAERQEGYGKVKLRHAVLWGAGVGLVFGVAAVFASGGSALIGALVAASMTSLTPGVIYDAKSRFIPRETIRVALGVTAVSGAAMLIYGTFLGFGWSLLLSLGLALIPAALFFVLLIVGIAGMGWSDIKLMTAMALLIGPMSVSGWAYAYLALAIAIVLQIGWLLIRLIFVPGSRKDKHSAFGPSLVAATGISSILLLAGFGGF